MTPEQIEMHRKRFEMLCVEKGGLCPVDGLKRCMTYGSYIGQDIANSWIGYLLCAENITVRELAESQGIKVKP